MVRLGLRMIGNLSQAGAQRIVAARAQAPFTSTEDVALRRPGDLTPLLGRLGKQGASSRDFH
jgi:DNA polymerase III alpha subunit